MRATRSVATAEWDVARIHSDHVPSREVEVVFLRHAERRPRRFEAWVVVAPSAMLSSIGVAGRGLYAARSFRRGDYLGRYSGEVVTPRPYRSREHALHSPETMARVSSGATSLMVVRSQGGGPGWVVVDGAEAGPPFLQRINDPRGTRLRPNVEVTEHGFVRVIASRIEAFDPEQPLSTKSELRFEYGEEYWQTQALLGTEHMPLRV